MPYATVSDVKAYLLIPATETSFDSEISDIIDFVDKHVHNILLKFFLATELPLSSTHEDFPVVKQYEAMWAAGVFRARRGEKLEGEHVLVTLAREGLLRYLAAKYIKINIV